MKSTMKHPLSFALLLAGTLPAQEPAKPTTQDAFFGLDKLWRIDLTVSSDAWESLYPKRRARIGLSMRGQFSYAKADLRIAGHELKNVGLRFKGNSTFWTTGGSLKRPLKIDFDRHVDGQSLLGLRKLNLQNNATDPTQLREAVSYRAYRQSGVPASRTCYARVYLTLSGQLDKEYLGLYTLAEQVDKDFLRHRFGSSKGLIVKPEGQTLAYLGDTWDQLYDAVYIPKSLVDHDLAARLIGFAYLVDQATTDDKTKLLGDHAGDYLNVDEFLRYVAVTTILVNLDSPFMLPHNFYMAVPARTKRVVWIPWDLNLSFGGFRMMGGARGDSSITKPTAVPGIARLLAIPAVLDRYKKICRELIDGPCSAKALLASIELASKTIKTAVADEWKRSDAVTKAPRRRSASRMGMAMMGRQPRSARSVERALSTTRDFVTRRVQNVRDQLDGKVKGRNTGFARFGRMSQSNAGGAAIGRFFVQTDTLPLDDQDRFSKEDIDAAIQTSFAALDANGSGTLERTEVEDEAGRQPAARAAFGGVATPAIAARRMWLRLDVDRNNKVDAQEWEAVIAAALAAWDRDKDGFWTRRDLTRRR